ncbi:LOW QUALITY PROTEIN: esterase 6-like [Cochliomyia hominivorax]
MKLKNLLNFTKIYILNILFIINVKCHKGDSFDSDLIVQIKNSNLKGKDRVYYYSYENIPYAKAAVAELRFEPPQEYDQKWRDIFDATRNPVTCMQWNQFKGDENKLEGSEDCLVHVYKPKTGKGKYPVLVYIHGGAFMFGAVGSFRENYLMRSGNLILVKIAYRLGSLEFLSTEDEIISGNYGLKDQAMALKWVKQNIHHFGGDYEKITLMGFSAGAASAHLQMLKPSLQTIAKSVISISGVALNPWVVTKNPLNRAMKIAHNLNCPNLETTQAIKYSLKKSKLKRL